MMSALPQAPAQAGISAILATVGGGRAGESGSGFNQLFAGLPAEQPIDAAPTLPNGELPLEIAGDPGQAKDALASQLALLSEPAAAAAPGEPHSAPGATAAAALLSVLDQGLSVVRSPAAASGTIAGAKATPLIDVANGVAVEEDTSASPDASPDVPALLAAILPSDAAPAAPQAAEPVLQIATAAKSATSIVPDTGASMTVIFAQPATHAAPAVLPAASAAPIAERVLDLASDDAWIAQLASDIAATKSQTGDISFRLMPRHLGRLDVAMTSDDAGVSVKLDTQHEATATIVHAAQGKLVDDLRQQGVRVAGAEVTCTPGETGRQSQGQGRAPANDPAHLIETAGEHAEPHREDRTASRRGRFA